jgi:hypothetical protein
MAAAAALSEISHSHGGRPFAASQAQSSAICSHEVLERILSAVWDNTALRLFAHHPSEQVGLESSFDFFRGYFQAKTVGVTMMRTIS